jgi:hypothetical protein
VALRRRGFVSVGAVVACCALAVACTPEQPSPTTPPTTPAATTPSESEIERQMRLDYDAAEQAYRANIAEQDRLYRRGGATRATAALKATATGEYLKITVGWLRDFHRSRLRAAGSSNVVAVERTGWKEGRVRLTACEDGSAVKIVDRSGRDVTPSEHRRFVQSLTAVRTGGQWKVSEQTSKRVSDFKGALCGD